MKKNYQSPQVKVVKAVTSCVICGSVESSFSISNDKVEEGSESDWSDTNLTW